MASSARSATRPLIRLKRLSEETGCEILGKAEFMNPGGSVKDRAALRHRLRAEERGELRSRRHRRRRHRRQHRHRAGARVQRARLSLRHRHAGQPVARRSTGCSRLLGAEVHQVPVVPYSNPNQYQKVAQRLAAALPNAIWSNQFDNTANRDAHARTTGPEIWAQTDGKLDAFVAASGTGGTFAGCADIPQVAARRRCAACWPIRPAAACTPTFAPARSPPPAQARSPKASASAASPRT